MNSPWLVVMTVKSGKLQDFVASETTYATKEAARKECTRLREHPVFRGWEDGYSRLGAVVMHWNYFKSNFLHHHTGRGCLMSTLRKAEQQHGRELALASELFRDVDYIERFTSS